jgi:hypothetical protein
MVTQNTRKTLEELQREVEQGATGIMSDQDLQSLFEEAGTTTQPNQPSNQPPAGQPAGSQAGQPGNQTPANGQPDDILTQIPDEFKDKDVPTSLGKMTKSISETRSAMDRQAREIQELRDLVETLRQPEPSQFNQQQQGNANSSQQRPDEDPDSDIDDTMIIEKPKEMVRKIAQREAARIAIAALSQYDTGARRERQIEAFRATHPDFDSVKDDMAAVVKDFPQLNRDPNALPKIYDLAKKRAEKRTAELRASLGTNVPQLSEEEVVSKAVDRIKAEIAKRRSASGIPSTGQGITPNQRMTPQTRTVPKTADEEIFDEMLNAGPAKLSFDL